MSGKRILAFEADPLYAQMLTDESKSRGYELEVVSDGAAGLENLEAQTPDLVYLCVELPRISGFSICNKIRKNPNLQQTPLIMTSADLATETFEKHQKLKVRADSYLHKPFDAASLFEVIDELLTRPPLGEVEEDPEDTIELDEAEEIEMEEISDIDEVAILEEEVQIEEDDELNSDLEDLEDFEDVEEIEEEATAIRKERDLDLLTEEAFDALEIKESIPRTTSAPPSAEQTAGLSDEVTQLETENKSLKDQVLALRSELTSARATRGGVSSREFLDLREQLNKKDRDLLDLKDEINRSEKTLLESRERLTELERAKADLQDKNLVLEKQLNEFSENIAALEADKELLHKKAGDFQTRIEHLQTKLKSTEGALEQESQARKDDERRLNKEKEEALQTLTEQKATEKQTALTEQKAEAQRETERALAEQKSELEIEYEKHREEYLREQRIRHETAIQSVTEQLERTKQDALDIQAAKHSGQIAELEKKSRLALEEEQQKFAVLSQEKTELDNTLAQREQNLESTRQELNESTELVKKLESEVTDLRGQIETLTVERQEAREGLERASEKVKEQEAGIEEREHRINGLINEIEEANYVIDRNTNLVGKTRQALSIAAKLLDDIYYDEDSDTIDEGDEGPVAKEN